MLNKVCLIGNLGDDPKITTCHNGTSAATISVATSEYWKDKETQEKKTRTTWHTVECYGGLADVVGEHTCKGMRVHVEGKINYDQWEDKETGEKKYRTKIVASHIIFLSYKDQKKAEADGNVTSSPQTEFQAPDDDEVSPNRAAWQKEKNRVAAKVTVKKKPYTSPPVEEDDIPF